MESARPLRPLWPPLANIYGLPGPAHDREPVDPGGTRDWREHQFAFKDLLRAGLGYGGAHRHQPYGYPFRLRVHHRLPVYDLDYRIPLLDFLVVITFVIHHFPLGLFRA